MFDERVSYIIQRMAMGPLTEDYEQGFYECLHCTARALYDDLLDKQAEDIRHKPGCAVQIARDILREQGTPIKVYKIIFQFREGKRWLNGGGYVLAISEEAAIRDCQHSNTRNIKAVFLRGLPAQEEQANA